MLESYFLLLLLVFVFVLVVRERSLDDSCTKQDSTVVVSNCKEEAL
jgi:hypothetical protein